ncbi:MAG: amino acid ABC transporter permease [Oscillospiraceae bacterium]|nr:amino acid ABC transporter permease [Oscillospiraceae bacterium]
MDLSLIGANIAKLWTNYWHIYLIEGVLTTLKLTIFAVVLGALLGIVVAMLKMSKNKIVRFLITVYIEVIRGTPLLLQLYIFYFVLPELLPIFDFNEFTWVAISLCINSSAYVSEIFRSGIQSVDKGQTEAARSLGLSSGQTMMRIVLPQAIKNILPALGNEFIMMLKETSLASTFFIGDLMTAHLKIKGATYLMLESLIITGIIYLCMTYPLSKLVEAFERKMKNAD